MAFDSRNWKAVQTARDLSGSAHDLTITGEVWVGRPIDWPVLSESVPQGTSDKILLVDVNVHVGDGMSPAVMTWKQAHYTREVKPGQFTEVTLLGAVEGQTIPVEVILS